MKKFQRTTFCITIVCACISSIFPSYGFAYSNLICPSDYDHIIYNLIECAHRNDIEGVELQLKNITVMLAESDDALRDSCEFIQHLVDKLNFYYGTTLTVSDVIRLSRTAIQQFPISEKLMQQYSVGFDLIELQNEENPFDIQSIKHKNDNNSFWTWLSVATVTAGAVTICIFSPQSTPAVVGGAVEIAKALLGK